MGQRTLGRTMHAAGRFGAGTLAAALGAAMLGASGGCHFEGGMGFSADHHTYVSTPWRPTTLSLLDTRTGETMWSVEVPAGKQCVVNFSKGKGPNERFPDVMEWEVMNKGRSVGTRSNRQAVPDYSARRLDVVYRPAPEMPGTQQAGPDWESVPPEMEMSAAATIPEAVESGEGDAGVASSAASGGSSEANSTERTRTAPTSAPAPAPAPAPAEAPSTPPAPPPEPASSDEPPVDLPE